METVTKIPFLIKIFHLYHTMYSIIDKTMILVSNNSSYHVNYLGGGSNSVDAKIYVKVDVMI